MNSKTRFLMALNHEKPDRLPFNFWMDRRLMADYEKRFKHRHWRVTHYGADVIESFINLPFPCGKFVEHEGSQWLSEPYPLNWDKVDDVPMPNPYSDDVFKFMQPDLDEFPDVAVLMLCATPWGYIGNMIGYERIFMDIMDYPQQYHALAQRITDTLKVVVERAIDAGITAIYIQEDVCTARGMSMSHETIENVSFKYARQLVEIATARAVPVLFHCCGKIMDIMDDFVNLGVHAINPLQPHLNDLGRFKQDYGDKLALYGGGDNCFTISQGTTEDVKKHVLDVFETVGKPDGGLVFSTHDIDINVPPENIEVLVETIKNCSY